MSNNNNNRPNVSSFDPLSTTAAPTVQQQPRAGHAQFPLNPSQISYLQEHGFSTGLIQLVGQYAASTPLRIWVLDNSSSMSIRDSHRILGSFHNIQDSPNVTRWEELQDCVAYHAQVASILPLPIRFALVNPPPSNAGPAVFGVGERGPAGTAQEIHVLKSVITQTQPSGPTPLTPHLAKIHGYISSIAQQLLRERKSATIVLATQGLPTDATGASSPEVVQQFVQSLQAFQNLPVTIVVRLCTDDEKAFDFYNSLDARLNFSYDVLDDFFGEALEVYLRNPWLTYGLPLHRFREFGFRIPLMDSMDERALTPHEVREFCLLVFGGHVFLPDPLVDWNSFLRGVSNLVSREKQQWNPITKSLTPWINVGMLNAVYGPKATQPSQPPRPQATFSQQNEQYASQQPPFPQQPWGRTQRPTSRTDAKPFQSAPTGVSQPTQSQQGRSEATVEDELGAVEKKVLTSWATQPPLHQKLKPLQELLGSVQDTFPLVEPHSYFEKYKPFSLNALSSNQQAVIKRAVRKLKFFLHPDKLPKDFTEKQTLLCKTLWDVTADSWESYQKTDLI